MQDSDFKQLLGACAQIAADYADGLVFIGGIAVYLHAINSPTTKSLAEFTHDADFYISLADLSDLRDREEVTSNRRLSKHQLIKRGFEFDIYTERLSSLLVPYDAVAAYAQRYDGIRVAAIEHLLVLKLEAFKDRKGSAKGEKDAKDILRIAAVSSRRQSGVRVDMVAPYLSGEHMDLLKSVASGPFATALANGNAVDAKRLRANLTVIVQALEQAGDAAPSERRAPRG